MGDGLNPETAYDYNGNIKAMTQYGLYQGTKQLIDNLSYTYKENGLSNKLLSVSDVGTPQTDLGDFKDLNTTIEDYTYDDNGNLTKDLNKNIQTITYNQLNLPQVITVAGKGTITYTYDAAGNKLSKTVAETGQAPKTTVYLGAMIFENNVLQFVSMEEGRLRPIPPPSGGGQVGAWAFDYLLKDHLGNVRMMLAETGEVLEETHYYPFGLTMSDISSSAAGILKNKHKFGGKELQSNEFSDNSGLEMYDFGARNYDQQIGRFWGGDKKADKLVQWSPYTYAVNNPILFLDPDGNFPYPIHIRSFAPFKSFGGGFGGDYRNFSTGLSPREGGSVTSRIQQTFTVDPSKGTITGGKPWSDPSSHPVLGTKTASDDRGGATATFGCSPTIHTASISANMAGANPLTPKGATPDIDVKSSINLTENLDKGILSVSANMKGDAFPSAEMFIGDTKGQQIMLITSAYEGNPFISLPGDNNRPMGAASIDININNKGEFLGVTVGTGKDATTYSPDAWNKAMKANPTGYETKHIPLNPPFRYPVYGAQQ